MNATNTWKDTIGCVAVLLAVVLSTASGACLVYFEANPVAAAGFTTQA
jgi:hypothetical protein